jgi:hypothetical protein
MNKEQEGKTATFEDIKAFLIGKSNLYKSEYIQAAIVMLRKMFQDMPTEEPMETTAAPEWVIEMMRTGKEVRCKVWDTNKSNKAEHLIIGYLTNYPLPYFCDQGTAWKHAEPISSWQPKDGDAVIYRTGIGNTASGIFKRGRIYSGENSYDAENARMLPFENNESKVGHTWSEI